MEGSIDELRDDDHPLFGSDEPAYVPGAQTRASRHRRRRRGRRRRRLVPLLSLLIVAALVAASYFIVKSAAGYFRTPDYSGAGTGTTRITINPGDTADDVAATMVKAGVVESSRAFINAAKSSGRAQDIQPGVWRVPLHASGAAAMAAILNPANELVTQVTIPEGFTEKQVLAALAAKTGLPLADLQKSANNVANLGLPAGFQPTSAEGFLFPSTYQLSPGMSADAVIQQITAQFSAEWTKLGLAAQAQAVGLTPYQGLIVASIIEGEAKFDSDRAKVARVILNRIKAGRPLQIDATSVYGAKVAGLDPSKVTYSTLNSPYNSYTHSGLPPTPIDNPGVASLQAGVNPAPGDWIYYVNGDAAGHLAFFDNEADFQAAAEKCKQNNWGCG
ncbi:MAG TPA: endolytic transglycosylase MltG [Jatrophihabitans sp.]|nr:endolytic transglycosylase MltG [Jatrophihabitans sp.]